MASDLYSAASWYVAAEDSDGKGSTIARSAEAIQMRQLLFSCVHHVVCTIHPSPPPSPSSSLFFISQPSSQPVPIPRSAATSPTIKEASVDGLLDTSSLTRTEVACRDVDTQGRCFPSDSVKGVIEASIAVCEEMNPDDALIARRLLSAGVPFEETEDGICFSEVPPGVDIEPLPNGPTLSDFTPPRRISSVVPTSSVMSNPTVMAQPDSNVVARSNTIVAAPAANSPAPRKVSPNSRG